MMVSFEEYKIWTEKLKEIANKYNVPIIVARQPRRLGGRWIQIKSNNPGVIYFDYVGRLK